MSKAEHSYNTIMNVYDRIREGQSIREIAKDVGVSPATICRLDNGSKPDLKTLFKIMDFVGCEFDFMKSKE